MFRTVRAAIFVILLSPGMVFAQGATFTITTASADVYKSPSTGSPVIGRAPRGTAHAVTRELGSWVRVEWPGAADGVGFLHVTSGRLVNGGTPEVVRAAAGEAVKAIPPPPPPVPASESIVARPMNVNRGAPVTPVPHVIGLGAGLMTGSPMGFGVTARAWRANRIGLRVDVARHAMGSSATTRVTSMQFEPSALVSLTDYVSNYLWLRPYVGAGLTVRHQTLRSGLTGSGGTLSDNSTGFQTFVGTELTVANAPQLALSADVNYSTKRSAFGAFDVGGLGVGLSAHWYVR
jgi:opacity protein-like surface antigen